ncbi:MAG: hypothetical protein E6L06_06025 [Verrucomicrobia bacterium]|nr:MAG: hypothetical protein E6L06_06025 [Verrucomicrobiota bacterium]
MSPHWKEKIQFRLCSWVTNEKLSCDLVVVGVGAVPVTELLEKTVIALDDGIVVNEYLETSRTGIYAAGDVANYPDTIF